MKIGWLRRVADDAVAFADDWTHHNLCSQT